MSNKLHRPHKDVKDKSLALFVGWLCLMVMLFLFFFIPTARSVAYMDANGLIPKASPSNAESVASIDTSSDEQIAIGFLTLDGKGIASSPFMMESELNVVWSDGEPTTFTALPLIMSGYTSEDETFFTVKNWGLYPYEMGTTGAADAYYTCIESGWQERFEDLWTEVYEVLNSEEINDKPAINAVVLQEILENVYGNEEFGDLRDIVTDCLVLVKDINQNGPSEEYNEQARAYYNRFYSWLCSFSVDLLKSE